MPVNWFMNKLEDILSMNECNLNKLLISCQICPFKATLVSAISEGKKLPNICLLAFLLAASTFVKSLNCEKATSLFPILSKFD